LQDDVLANRKLRKLILLRAYNKRASDMSVQDQFRKYVQVDENGCRYVESTDCMRELGIGDKKLAELTKRFGVQLTGRLEYQDFLTFLENGGDKCKTPVRKARAPAFPVKDARAEDGPTLRERSGNQEPSPGKMAGKKAPVSAPESPKAQKPPPVPPMGMPASSPQYEPPSPNVKAPPPPLPPGMSQEPANTLPVSPEQQEAGPGGQEESGEQPEMLDCVPVIEEPETPRGAEGDGAGGKKLVKGLANPEDGAIIEFVEQKEWEPPFKSLWKKREVVINEKITEYTKVDDDGVMQMLVESEKSQTEVLHMESKDGEFAHRETTEFEQFEKFNEELVMHQTGTERFVHLKSHEDEFSHFESSMPEPGEGQAEAEQGPPPPMAGDHPSVTDDADKPLGLSAFTAPFHNILFFLEERDMVASTIACHRWRISVYEFVQFIQEAQQEAQLTEGLTMEQLQEVEEQITQAAAMHGWNEEQMTEQRLIMLSQMQEEALLSRLPPEAVQDMEEKLTSLAQAEGWAPEQFMMQRRNMLIELDQEMQQQMEMMHMEQQAMADLAPEAVELMEQELQQMAMEEDWSQEQYMHNRALRLMQMQQEQGI
jgi:hypothetical protein